MYKTSICKALPLVLVLAMLSCQRELPVSYPPEYETPLRFTLDDPESVMFQRQNDVRTVSVCKAGDSVTVFLPTVYAGAYIYNATYRWVLELRGGDVIERRTIEQEAPCQQGALPPKWTFEAPDSAGAYVVYFRATYEYSASTTDGSLYGAYPISSGNHGYEDKSSVYGVLEVRK